VVGEEAPFGHQAMLDQQHKKICTCNLIL
jgi:hypothetical protein